MALRIHMTALPQLVAAFHSLVGLAAVFVAAAAFVSPEAFGIGSPGHIKTQSLIEMGLGTMIGAIAVALAAVNIFGGFIVTHRMLSMFKKKTPVKK